jgi:hypothetical protein
LVEETETEVEMDGSFGRAFSGFIWVVASIAAVVGWAVIESIICIVKWLIHHVRFV